MKKLILLTAVLALNAKVFAQQAVPNGTFESWTSVSYNEPNQWNTGNVRDLQKMGTASVSKVTGYSGFALRIQTNAIGADTSESYIINTNNPCNDPDQWTGGVPYSQTPTALTGYFRYNLPGNDSAMLFVIFRKNGLHIGDNFIKFRGTGSQLTFASFSFPVTCAGLPDTMIIAASSSNKKATGVENGSFLELDNLAFTGTTQPIPNGNFESWTATSYDLTNGWEAWGSGVSQTTSVHSGSYAIRLETQGSMCGGINSSGITTGHLSPSSGPKGGIPYINMSDTLCGYYKYTSVGNDTASVSVSLSNSGTMVGGNNKRLSAAATYTYFEIAFQAGSVPDTIRIDAESSKWPYTNANSGSVLYLDDLHLKSFPLGINEPIALKSNCYPNPVKDQLLITFEKSFCGTMEAFIYDVTGRKTEMNSLDRNSNSMRIDVSDLSNGIYFYEIKTNDGVMRNKFIKQ